jgi:hypothetical protein
MAERLDEEIGPHEPTSKATRGLPRYSELGDWGPVRRVISPHPENARRGEVAAGLCLRCR